jgi:hypothetical protein
MLLNERVEAVVTIRGAGVGLGGHSYMEATLVDDDAQTLHLYEGQLKEVSQVDLHVGETYKVVFQPFINNRWIEFKIAALEPAAPGSP